MGTAHGTGVGTSAGRGAVIGVVAAACVLLSLLAGPAGRASGATSTTTEQTWETGVVDHVSDGDTVAIDITSATHAEFVAPPAATDPATSSARTFCRNRLNANGSMPKGGLDGCRVRLIGLNTPESAGNSGSPYEQCKASAATATVKALLPKGTKVQLRALSWTSAELDHSGGRLARTVYYRTSSGAWVDVARAVLAKGQAMWFPFRPTDPEKPEYAHNLEYRRVVDEAAAARKGLWSAGYCGSAGTGTANPTVWVVSNPPGDDANREYVVLLNPTDRPMDVSGWTVRDSSLIATRLPSGTVIPAGDYIRVLSGKGAARTPTARDFHFGSSSQMFTNATATDPDYHGDAAYVHDVQPGYAYGNLRAWYHYPCDPAHCRDPLVGAVTIGLVQYNPPGSDTAGAEYVELRNTTAAPVRLGGYALRRQSVDHPLPPIALIPAGGTLRIGVGRGVESATSAFLGRTSSYLANSGDRVALVNLNGAPVDCRAWGRFTCTGSPVSGALEVPRARPATPRSVTATYAKGRVRVSWSAPAPNGSAAVTRYRATVRRTSGGKLVTVATCYARAPKLTCTSATLRSGRTYKVTVAARNSRGYGTRSAYVSVKAR